MQGINLADDSIEAFGGFEPMTPGRYLIQCIESEYRNDYSDNTKEGFNLRFEVVEPAEYEGRNVWKHLVFPNNDDQKFDAALRFLKGALIALGFGNEDLAAISTPAEFDEENFIGRKCIADINIQEYNGKKSNNIRNMYTEDEAELGGGDNLP